jgi:hypothetical protein
MDQLKDSFWYGTRSPKRNCKKDVMKNHRSQTDFIRALILHGNSAERDTLLDRMAKAEQDEHSSRCALILVIVLSILSTSAVCCGAVLLPDFFRGTSHRVFQFFCLLGLASLICSVVFSGCWLWYRGVLNRLHRESRRFLLGILESQSKPSRTSLISAVNLGSNGAGEETVPMRASPRGYLELPTLRRAS